MKRETAEALQVMVEYACAAYGVNPADVQVTIIPGRDPMDMLPEHCDDCGRGFGEVERSNDVFLCVACVQWFR